MAGFSDFLETAVLNLFRGTDITAPAAVYVGLFSAAPNDAGGGTEVTTTLRAAGRVAATFAAPSGGSIASDAVVDFGAAEGSASVTHYGLFDAASGGNLLAYAAVTTPLAITPGILVEFPIGAITVTLD